jgi:uncharacterized protein (DUF433 family)
LPKKLKSPACQRNRGFFIAAVFLTKLLKSTILKRFLKVKIMQKDLLNRISTNGQILTGKPVIKGTRLSVEYILNLLAQGETTEEIVEEYEGLVKEDIYACLLFAAQSLENISFMPLTQQAA